MHLLAGLALLAAQTSEFFPDTYSLLCESEDVRGYRWSAGRYEPREFLNNKLIVSARPENNCFKEVERDAEWITPTIAFREVCLNVRDFGSDYDPIASVICKETYDFEMPRGGLQIQCYNAASVSRFSADGGFMRSNITGYLDLDRPGRRDDLAIEWGRCSRVS